MGTAQFNAPNDVISFIGVWSDTAFDRAEIREIIGFTEGEYFGEFYTGTIPLSALQITADGAQECGVGGGSTFDFTASVLQPGVGITSIEWFLDRDLNPNPIGFEETLTAFIPLGQHTIEADAMTSEPATRTGALPIEIVDTIEPEIAISFSDLSGQPITAISRNGLNRIVVDVDATDACDAEPSTTAVGGAFVVSDEVVEILPARSQIKLTGEDFAVTVTATDASGNVAQKADVLPVVE